MGTDFWFTGLPSTPAKQLMSDLADCVEETLNDPRIIRKQTECIYSRLPLLCIFGGHFQPQYAKVFKDMSENDLDRIMQSFALKNCIQHQGVIEVVKKHMARPA